MNTQPLGSICILGYGKTGKAVASYCNSIIKSGSGRISSLTVFESDKTAVTGTYDLAIVSPGIPPASAFYQAAQAAAREVISEPEFAWRESPERWIGVTGTNGKSTTTALIAHLLQVAGANQGYSAQAAGNIGLPCIEAITTRGPRDWIVAELSSYQLHSTQRFAPDAAVLLNITPDHLSWHGSHEAYTAAKLRIFANMPATAPRIIDATLADTRHIMCDYCRAGQRVIPLGAKPGLATAKCEECDVPEGAYVDAATGLLTVVVPGGEKIGLIPAADLLIKGPHNQENALAAAAAVLAVGAEPEAVRAGLASFEPLEHRIEPVGEHNGVLFYNDSKATNTDAAIKALTSFSGKPIVVLLGGRDKGTALDELVDVCRATCKAAVCYGEAGPRFLAALQAAEADPAAAPATYGLQAVSAEHLADAFTTAVGLAAPGDVLLLSPACASFDEYTCFEQRGEDFKRLVATL
jgi:UDP-N-acetylmuramoylalanine--D-glutamate ligase